MTVIFLVEGEGDVPLMTAPSVALLVCLSKYCYIAPSWF